MNKNDDDDDLDGDDKDDEERSAKKPGLSGRGRGSASTRRRVTPMGPRRKPGRPVNPASKPKPKPVYKMKCSACGLQGHMRTNKECPVYAITFPHLAAPGASGGDGGIAKTDEQLDKELSAHIAQGEAEGRRLVSVEGTKIKFTKDLVRHAEKVKRDALVLKFPKTALHTAVTSGTATTSQPVATAHSSAGLLSLPTIPSTVGGPLGALGSLLPSTPGSQANLGLFSTPGGLLPSGIPSTSGLGVSTAAGTAPMTPLPATSMPSTSSSIAQPPQSQRVTPEQQAKAHALATLIATAKASGGGPTAVTAAIEATGMTAAEAAVLLQAAAVQAAQGTGTPGAGPRFPSTPRMPGSAPLGRPRKPRVRGASVGSRGPRGPRMPRKYPRMMSPHGLMDPTMGMMRFPGSGGAQIPGISAGLLDPTQTPTGLPPTGMPRTPGSLGSLDPNALAGLAPEQLLLLQQQQRQSLGTPGSSGPGLRMNFKRRRAGGFFANSPGTGMSPGSRGGLGSGAFARGRGMTNAAAIARRKSATPSGFGTPLSTPSSTTPNPTPTGSAAPIDYLKRPSLPGNLQPPPPHSGRARADPKVSIASIFESIIASLKEYLGPSIVTPFLLPVSRKDAPNYHNVVKEPMDIQTLRENVAKHKYATREAFLKDMSLIVENSAIFNGPQHHMTDSARQLFEYAAQRIEEHENQLMKLEKAINPLLDDDETAIAHIFGGILDKLKSINKSFAFHMPVDRKKIKAYYDKIKEPMDLGTMQAKTKSRNPYGAVAEFLHDVELIYKNSESFNGPPEKSTYTAKAKEILDTAKQLVEENITQLSVLEKNVQEARARAAAEKQSDSRSTSGRSSQQSLRDEPGGSQSRDPASTQDRSTPDIEEISQVPSNPLLTPNKGRDQQSANQSSSSSSGGSKRSRKSVPTKYATPDADSKSQPFSVTSPPWDDSDINTITPTTGKGLATSGAPVKFTLGPGLDKPPKGSGELFQQLTVSSSDDDSDKEGSGGGGGKGKVTVLTLDDDDDASNQGYDFTALG